MKNVLKIFVCGIVLCSGMAWAADDLRDLEDTLHNLENQSSILSDLRNMIMADLQKANQRGDIVLAKEMECKYCQYAQQSIDLIAQQRDIKERMRGKLGWQDPQATGMAAYQAQLQVARDVVEQHRYYVNRRVDQGQNLALIGQGLDGLKEAMRQGDGVVFDVQSGNSEKQSCSDDKYGVDSRNYEDDQSDFIVKNNSIPNGGSCCIS